MSASEADEGEVQAIQQALSAAEQPLKSLQRLPLPAVVSELRAWLNDERQWHGAYASNWKSLISDVERSLTACPANLAGALALEEAEVLDELRAVRNRISSSTVGPDASLRRRLERVCEYLEAQLEEPRVLVATFEDLIVAVRSSKAGRGEEEARALIDIAVAAGHPRKWLAGRLRALLRDDAYEIAEVRSAPTLPDDPEAKAGTSPSERLGLVREYLEAAPRRGHVVVWMDYQLARVGWPPIVRLGDHVALYNSDWLRDCLTHSDLEQLPPEVQVEPHPVQFLTRTFPENEERGEAPGRSARQNEAPVAYVRVDLGDVRIADARHLALETAEAVVSLASLYGLAPSIWQPGSSWVTYIDGKEGGASFGTPQTTSLSVDERIALDERDHTANTLEQVADLLGPHLPVRDALVAETCTLLGWLRQARRAAPPARLLLCDRVIEQVSGWAGVADRSYFVREHLGLAWSYGRVRSDIAAVGWSVQFASNPSAQNDQRWTDIYPPNHGVAGQLNLQALLRHLPWLIDQVPEGGKEWHAATELLGRTRSGRAATAWLREVDGSFVVLESRARRTRNALVHGGPLSEETVGAVVNFVDTLAADALNVSLQGRLAGSSLIDHFLARRATFLRSRRLLTEGQDPAEALFWEDRGGL